MAKKKNEEPSSKGMQLDPTGIDVGGLIKTIEALEAKAHTEFPKPGSQTPGKDNEGWKGNRCVKYGKPASKTRTALFRNIKNAKKAALELSDQAKVYK